MKKQFKFIFFIVILIVTNHAYSQKSYHYGAPENYRRVGKLNLVVRHAFPSTCLKEPFLNRDPNRPVNVNKSMLSFLKKEKVMIIFDVADLWTHEEIKFAKESYGIEVTKRINFNKFGYRTPEMIEKTLAKENIRFFLEKVAQAEEEGSKISIHCRGGIHRAGILSAVYLIEREGMSNAEAAKYWKVNAIPVDFERYLGCIARVENWDTQKVKSVHEQCAEIWYPGENSFVQFLKNYKKIGSR